MKYLKKFQIGHIFWLMWLAIVWVKFYPTDYILANIAVGAGVALGSIWQLWKHMKKYIKLPL